MNLFKPQFEFEKPHCLVWRLESPANTEVVSQEKPKSQIEELEGKLSPQGKELWAEIKKELEDYKKNFIKDAKGTVIQESLVTTGGNANVYGEFANAFIFRIDQSGLSYLKRIVDMDEQFEAQKEVAKDGKEIEKIEEKYRNKVDHLRKKMQGELEKTAHEFSSAAEGFGKGQIDSNAELALLAQNMNVLRDVGLSGLITKLQENGRLTDDDYEFILKGLTELTKGKKVDNSRLDRTTDSVRAVEMTGKTAILNLMSPAQRFKLGELLVNEAKNNGLFSEEQAHQGLLNLSAMGFLDIGQVKALLNELGRPLETSEEKEIRGILEKMPEIRKKMEEAMKEGGGGNWIKKHITGSVVLIYEIAGRIGLLGMALPFILNITHPEQWIHIAADPVWLGCAALSGLAIDHVTGGMGKGQVSKLIKSAREKYEPEKLDIRETRILGKLDTLCGNNEEIYGFLRNTDRLRKLETKAEEYEANNKGKYYSFKWEDLKDANGNLPAEATQEMDGHPANENQGIIDEFFMLMHYELGLTDPNDMKKVLDGSPERRAVT